MIPAAKRRSLLAVCALALAFPLLLQAAGIYKRELPDGTVLYSDQPHPEAREVQPTPPQVVEPFKPVTGVFPTREEPREAPEAYARLAITAPANDEVIWSNERLVDLTVEVAPPVRTWDGHTLLILMDGEPVARSKDGTALLLENVFRGTHVLEAVIEDGQGQVLRRSAPVTFHMRQHSLLSPARP